MKRIRVLIIEDSGVVRQLIEYIVGHDPRLEVAAAVGSAEEALRILGDVSPDVISMDIRLPGMNGLEATRRIMAERPTPIVVVAGGFQGAEPRIAAEALQAGALAVLEKPAGVTSPGHEASAQHLCTQLAIMSAVMLVRRRAAGTPDRYQPMSELPAAPHPGAYRMMGIVCSTGGPRALKQILGALGSSFPLPIAVVQHIAGRDFPSFAAWLQNVTSCPVVIVGDRAVPAPGCVYLAAPDRHLLLERGVLLADEGNPVGGQRPSGTVLFGSMAADLGGGALGVLLTGMGEDGAAGLLRLRDRGGHTIAECESTAVVYGMPSVAVRLGAVCESLPLPAIGPRVLDLTLPMLEVAL
jgi:two-component system, chemotaxis family, protein-glutamate methylesterase/glutaminase